MRGKNASFSEEVFDYLAEHSRQDALLAEIERETSARDDAAMQVTPDQGALLTLLARLVGATKALEVGTFTGYSAICIARGLSAGGRLTCLEIDEELASIAGRNVMRAELDDRVEIRVGPAKAALEAMPEEPVYDFVFIDADKGGYGDYYELALARMRPGALMLVDNVLLSERVLDPRDGSARAVAALNDRISGDERVDAAFALIADGLAFVRKR